MPKGPGTVLRCVLKVPVLKMLPLVLMEVEGQSHTPEQEGRGAWRGEERRRERKKGGRENAVRGLLLVFSCSVFFLVAHFGGLVFSFT